jgi:hypothetical protein
MEVHLRRVPIIPTHLQGCCVLQLMVKAMPITPTECNAYSAPRNATFLQWLSHYPSNWVVRELCGASTLYQRAGHQELSPHHLLLAKKRLHYFDAVLVTEDWEGSMRLMQREFGWKHLDYRHHRAGSLWNSSAERELSADELRAVRASTELDEALYSYAVTLHLEQLSRGVA